MVPARPRLAHVTLTKCEGESTTAATGVSFAEEQLWLAEQRDPTAHPFLECKPSMSLAARLEGPLDIEALEASLNGVIRDQEVLRSIFFSRGGRLLRQYEPEGLVNIAKVELDAMPEDSASQRLERLLADHAQEAFDLRSAPLMRAILVTLGGDRHVLSVTLPHIVFDRWSKRVLALELRRRYGARLTGDTAQVPPPPAQYRDYVKWQRQRLEGSLGHQLRAYWFTRLGDLTDLSLPRDKGDHHRRATTRSATVRFVIAAPQVARLRTLSRRFRVTLATLTLAIVQLFLHRVTSQQDIAVGVPLSDRRRPEFVPLIGLFMNLVVVRTSITSDLTFRHVVDRVRRSLVDACRHQDMPFGYLARTLERPAPLYRVVFSFMPAVPASSVALPGIRATPLWVDVEPPSLADLSVRVLSTANGMAWRLAYRADWYSPALVHRFAEQLQNLVSGVLDDCDKLVDAYELDASIPR